MSNSTNLELVSTLTDPFLNWFSGDILPYLVAGFDITTIIIGSILNIILIVTFKKRRLFNEPSSYFVFMLCIADFIAYALMLLPTVITSFTRDWMLTTQFCWIHGCMIALMVYVPFSFMTLLAVERAVKLVNTELYEKTFESKKVLNFLMVGIWVLSTVVSFVTLSGIAEVRYDFFHQGCMLDYQTSYILLNVHFATTFGTSFVVLIVCYCCIFDNRRRALKDARVMSLKANNSAGKRRRVAFVHEKASGSLKTGNKDVSRDLPTAEESEDSFSVPILSSADDNTLSSADDKIGKRKAAEGVDRKRTPRGIRRNSRRKSAQRKSLVVEVFSDDNENPAFHLAITYLLLYLLIVLCYLPYYIVWYYDLYTAGGLWDGFYTIALLVLHASFALKPIIYLGHNHHYRAVTKETIPESVRERASAVRNSVSTAVDRVDDFIFRSTTNKRFAATVAAQKAVLVWKKKLNGIRMKRIDSNQKTEDKIPVIGAKASENSAEHESADGEENSNAGIQPGPHTAVVKSAGGHRSVDLRSQPVTPSKIEITSSSFIERERQRLMGRLDRV